jgi:hypothetical protein
MGRQADIGLRHIAARGGQLLMRTRRIVGLPGWGKVRSRPVDWTAFKTRTRLFQFLWIITSVPIDHRPRRFMLPARQWQDFGPTGYQTAASRFGKDCCFGEPL